MRLKHDETFDNDGLVQDEANEGIMQKMCPKISILWQNRYFVLKHRMLRYYKSEAEYKAGKPARGILNFQQVSFSFTADVHNLRISL